tara:strand:- start:291 stop:482 length:192 start_codon:yes stop_codon:yes gene_type:complete
MVLLDTHQENHTYSEFEAKIKILHHTSISSVSAAGYLERDTVGDAEVPVRVACTGELMQLAFF